jgi:polyhydroxyalkanoate synthesis regulator phasin
MSEAEKDSAGSGTEAVGEALRSAVERTLAATAESATGTRDRAQGVLDDVVRRGRSAREEVARRGESATSRLADAIGELRAADGEAIGRLGERLDEIERRLAALEASEKPSATESKAQVEAEVTPLEPDEQGDPRD